MSKPPLYTCIVPPQFNLSSPDALLSERDFDLLRTNVEDFRYATREVTRNLGEVASEIRSRSTTLRRLLCHNDLFNAGRLFPPKEQLRVRARMLEFDPLYPSIIITCGNYPWADDILPGMAAELSVKGIDPLPEPVPWSYRDEELPLSEYLDGLAIGVLGTRIKRRQLVKYVADKKAAHFADNRKHPYEQALDRAWSHLSMRIACSDGTSEQLNVVYLEIMALIRALRESTSINGYIDDLDAWLSTAEFTYGVDVKGYGVTLPIDPE